jgi:hypothetical protein
MFASYDEAPLGNARRAANAVRYVLWNAYHHRARGSAPDRASSARWSGAWTTPMSPSGVRLAPVFLGGDLPPAGGHAPLPPRALSAAPGPARRRRRLRPDVQSESLGGPTRLCGPVRARAGRTRDLNGGGSLREQGAPARPSLRRAGRFSRGGDLSGVSAVGRVPGSRAAGVSGGVPWRSTSRPGSNSPRNSGGPRARKTLDCLLRC